MIYVAFEECGNTPDARHEAGIRARDRLFSTFGVNSEVKKTENGKPYIPNSPYHFSISHSDELAVCVLRCKEEKYDLAEDIFTIFEDGEGEVGADIQAIPSSDALARMNRIAARYMNTQYGSTEAFARVWTKKEAYTKLRDIPLTHALKAEITEGIIFSGKITVNEKDYYFSVLI